MKISELTIGKMLLMSVIIASVLVLYGVIAFLMQQGNVIAYYNKINLISGFSIRQLFVALANKSPFAYIELGVLVLFIAQIIRALFASIIFLEDKEVKLFFIGFFVFVVLFGSIFINY